MPETAVSDRSRTSSTRASWWLCSVCRANSKALPRSKRTRTHRTRSAFSAGSPHGSEVGIATMERQAPRPCTTDGARSQPCSQDICLLLMRNAREARSPQGEGWEFVVPRLTSQCAYQQFANRRTRRLGSGPCQGDVGGSMGGRHGRKQAAGFGGEVLAVFAHEQAQGHRIAPPV